MPVLFFLNVFKGDLSIIGPRPQTQRCFDAFQKEAQNQFLRVKPGITGIGSILFRNEEEMMGNHEKPDEFYNEVIMQFKGELEIWYVSEQSFFVDCKLFFLTAWVVLGGNAKLAYRLLNNLPPIPQNLSDYL